MRDGHRLPLNTERVVTGRSVERGLSRGQFGRGRRTGYVCYVCPLAACRVLAGGRANSRSTSTIR